MMRLVALRLRSDLDSHSRTVTEGLTFQKIGKLAGIILLVSTSLAYGQFFHLFAMGAAAPERTPGVPWWELRRLRTHWV